MLKPWLLETRTLHRAWTSRSSISAMRNLVERLLGLAELSAMETLAKTTVKTSPTYFAEIATRKRERAWVPFQSCCCYFHRHIR